MSPKFHVEDQWYVSPYNLVPEVRNTFQLPRVIIMRELYQFWDAPRNSRLASAKL